MADPQSYSASDVEIAPSYSASDVEIAPPAALPPEVQHAIAGVPRPQLDYMDTEPTLTHPWADPRVPISPRAVAAQKAEAPYSVRDALVGGLTDVLTNPAPGAESGIPALGPEAVQSTHELQTRGQRVRGALRAANVGLEAATPLVGPAAIEAPISTALGFGEGYVAGKGAKYGA